MRPNISPARNTILALKKSPTQKKKKKKKEYLAEGSGVELAKYPPNVKLEIFSQL